jgi:hypothetical protein
VLLHRLNVLGSAKLSKTSPSIRQPLDEKGLICLSFDEKTIGNHIHFVVQFARKVHASNMPWCKNLARDTDIAIRVEGSARLIEF